MLNIERYKDEIIEEYNNSFGGSCTFNGDGHRMNKAIKKVAFEKCGEKLGGAREPLIWLASEYKEPILDDVEKEYLSNVIKPFKKHVSIIFKTVENNCEQITIQCATRISDSVHITLINLPPFEKGRMYRNMEDNKEYTREEIGL